MTKFKFKKDINSEHFELSAVQDVKVNNQSVFDGEEANINLKTINNQSIVGEGNVYIDIGYEITVPQLSERLKILDNDLEYIRENKPKILKIKFENTGIITELFLGETNTNYISYDSVINKGDYELYSYYLKIENENTYTTGCYFTWVGYLVAPNKPSIYLNRTYTFKLINGQPTWVQDT